MLIKILVDALHEINIFSATTRNDMCVKSDNNTLLTGYDKTASTPTSQNCPPTNLKTQHAARLAKNVSVNVN